MLEVASPKDMEEVKTDGVPSVPEAWEETLKHDAVRELLGFPEARIRICVYMSLCIMDKPDKNMLSMN